MKLKTQSLDEARLRKYAMLNDIKVLAERYCDEDQKEQVIKELKNSHRKGATFVQPSSSSNNQSLDTQDAKQIMLNRKMNKKLGVAWLKTTHVTTLKGFFKPLYDIDLTVVDESP